MKPKPLLTVNELRVQIHTPSGIIQPVDGVSFTVSAGEIFALVGESGCGKSMTALAISRLLPENAYLCKGSEIYLNELALHRLCEKDMTKVRGAKVAMVFQDPNVALNPVLTIGDQIVEALQRNKDNKNNTSLKNQAIELLEKVQFPTPLLYLSQYPHQLSGGLKQRVVIALALAQSPDLLIADEPTTALDVTTQAQVLKLLKILNKEFNMAILLITHDFGIVAQMADTVAVMYAGHIIEQAPQKIFLNAPKHPYSQQLLAALPERTSANHQLATIPGQVPSLDKNFTLCRFKDRCTYVFKPCEINKPAWLGDATNHFVRCHWYDKAILETLPLVLRIQSLQNAIPLEKMIPQKEILIHDENEMPILSIENLKVYFPIRKGLFKKTIGYVKAVDDISLKIFQGQTLALVGESGCGKTTTGKAILRLIPSLSGTILFQNENMLTLSERKLRKSRGELQMVFQDPYSSMDPRMHVNEIIEEGMLALGIGTDANERQERITELLRQVGLSPFLRKRYPHELSGGQRQRVAIARALAVGAQLIICDEPTSALDVSVQAQILNLLKSLQEDLDISYLFITHNIAAVNYLADHIAVMHAGRIVEYGAAQDILQAPQHPYTQKLLASVPYFPSKA